MTPVIANDAYMRAYMNGYTDALQKHNVEEEKTFFGVKDIMERYDISQNKAYEILQAIRQLCNGGKLGAGAKVLPSELKYWESTVEKVYKERL